MAPFRAKIGGKRIREGEKRNYRFIPFLSGAEQKMQIKIKNYRFVPFLPNALQKIPKKFKKKKNTIMASFQARIG